MTLLTISKHSFLDIFDFLDLVNRRRPLKKERGRHTHIQHMDIETTRLNKLWFDSLKCGGKSQQAFFCLATFLDVVIIFSSSLYWQRHNFNYISRFPAKAGKLGDLAWQLLFQQVIVNNWRSRAVGWLKTALVLWEACCIPSFLNGVRTWTEITKATVKSWIEHKAGIYARFFKKDKAPAWLHYYGTVFFF